MRSTAYGCAKLPTKQGGGAGPMQCKTGSEHIKSLQDGRTVYLDGKLVDDVTTHAAYRNAVASAALLYDYQARPENIELMTFMPEGGTRRVNRCWQMPRTYDELVQRRKALQAWAQISYGFMGRSPDHVASTVIGQCMGLGWTCSGTMEQHAQRRLPIMSNTPRAMTCS